MEPKTAFALKSLAAADLAPSLCDEIQSIYEQNLAIARRETVTQAKALVANHLNQLPEFLGVNLSDGELIELVEQFL